MKKYKIDDLFVLIRNGANIKQDPNADGIPITRIETTSNDKFNRNKVGFANVYDSQPYKNFILQDQDLLMSHINSEKYLGRCVLYNKQDNECIIHGMNLLMLRANINLINPRYINLYFKSAGFKSNIAKITKKSVNQASFNVNSLKNIEVNIPELSEQEKIADKFDKLFALIEQNKTLLAKYDELVKSQFIEMFDNKNFDIDKIEKVCTLKSGVTFDKQYELSNGDLMYCKVSDMNLLGNEKYMNNSKSFVSFNVGHKSMIPANAVIFPKRGGAIGTNKKRITKENTCVDLNTMAVIPNDRINIQYLYQYFQNIDLGSLCDGSTVPQLNNKNIGPLKISIPPIELQNQFADFVKHIDKLKFKETITIFKYICYNIFNIEKIKNKREVKMANFEYLKDIKDFKDLYEYCSTSESFVVSNPDISASFSRKALEFIVKSIYQLKLGYVPKQATLFELVDNYVFSSFISDRETMTSLHFIRKIGNLAVHNEKITKSQAMACLENLHFFVGEVLISLGVIKDYEAFDKNITKPQEQIKAISDKPVEINEKVISKYADKINANTVLKTKRSMPEAETRKLYIDCWLKEAGWDVLSVENQRMPCKAGIEIRVENMPNDKGFGFCDYVLFGRDGRPLAVVEAKKKDVDPIKGEHQAQLYADCLEKEVGYRPVVYYTNGYETRIIEKGYPARTIYGFHTLEELELFIQKRGNRQITNFAVDSNIAGRPYQKMAITSVCEHLNAKHRKALIVMATGTGKTRTAIALVELLKRNNFVKNVLFLADRVELVKQAKKNFVKLLPHESVCVLSDKLAKKELDARIVFSTYQTMINYIDKEDKKFGIGRFDLIIVDEAHRSIFNKYRAIFLYFDSLLVGLTATPRAEVDRSTYTMFGLEDGYPNFHYELDEAVKDKYLVGYNVFDRTSEIMKRGFKYSDLSPEERQEIETEYAITMDGEYNLDYDVLNKDTEVSGNKLFKKFFNRDTIRKVLRELMRDGLKVNNGENIGKSIIFAPNHKTAEMVVDEFKKMYPKYGNDYCALIDNYVTYAGDLIEKFGISNKLPQIAVSVDMLDTGIDVPEVLNLVFFRAVKSKIKFLQMIGRGTRLCENIRVFSPSRDYFEGRISEPDMNIQKDKQGFYIFDYCDNFRFFETYVEPKKSGVSLNLTQRIFNMKAELVFGLQTLEYQKDPYCVDYRESLVKDLRTDINALSPNQILVKEKLQYVDKFRDDEKWQYLTKIDLQELKAHITELVSPTADDELAKIFDLKIFNIEVSLLDSKQDSTKSQNAVIVIAQALANMTTIPQIRVHIPMIEKVQTKQYWENLTIQGLEELRKELRELIKFIDGTKLSKIYEIDINDTITENGRRSGIVIAGMKTYEQKVIDYLAENSNKEVIQKIKNLEKINAKDLKELEHILWSELGTKEDYFKFTEKENLAVFVRSIVGLEQQAINLKFGQFLAENVLNSRQQEFVKTIISYVRENGDVTFDNLVNSSPFDNIDIIRMFGDKIYVVQKIVEQLHGAVMCA